MPGSRPSELSVLDRDLLALIAAGKTGAEIAALMHITVSAEQSQRQALLQFTGARNTAELVSWAYQNRILTIKE